MSRRHLDLAESHTPLRLTCWFTVGPSCYEGSFLLQQGAADGCFTWRFTAFMTDLRWTFVSFQIIIDLTITQNCNPKTVFLQPSDKLKSLFEVMKKQMLLHLDYCPKLPATADPSWCCTICYKMATGEGSYSHISRALNHFDILASVGNAQLWKL